MKHLEQHNKMPDMIIPLWNVPEAKLGIKYTICMFLRGLQLRVFLNVSVSLCYSKVTLRLFAEACLVIVYPIPICVSMSS